VQRLQFRSHPAPPDDRSFIVATMARTAIGIVALGAILVVAERAPGRQTPPPRRPSVLLITLDTTRADALGVYGGPEWATPNLDRVARAGVRFATARAPAPVTLPAHASILTGLFPFQHGVRDNGTFKLPDGANTLAERLQAAGYATAAVPGSFVVDSSFGLAQGFDRYFDLPPDPPGAASEAERPASEVVALATKWLASVPPERPFFLWVHFFDAHFPYQPPPDLQIAHPLVPDPKRTTKGGQKRDALSHDYQLEVAAIDRELPPLFKALDRFGGAGPVVVAVLGDHGEGLGEHGEATHSALLHDATLRVPFLLEGGGLPAGKVVAEPVTTVDFAPTLLALLGLPGDGTAGADLRPLLEGKPLATTRPLYAESCATWFTFGWAPLYSLIVQDGGTVGADGKPASRGDDAWKVVFGRTTQLFDMAHDAGEKHDVADAHGDLVEAARERLRELADKTIEATRQNLDDDAKKKLAGFGYLVNEQSAKRGGLVPPGWQPKTALTPEEGLKNQRRYSQANQLWLEGKRDEGLAQLLELTKLEPENSHYASAAAALLMTVKRPAEALPLAQKAVELAESGATRTTLVACLIALGRRDEALAEAKTTVDLFPKLLAAKLTFAELLCASGRAADAVAPLEAWLAGATGDATTRAHAQALLEQARAAQAKAGGGK
jgi:arylsulfatase A-like enzyme